MRLLDVYYFKDGVGVDTFNEANEAHIYEISSKGEERSGTMVILDHSDRGILPEKGEDTVETTKEELDKLFNNED